MKWITVLVRQTYNTIHYLPAQYYYVKGAYGNYYYYYYYWCFYNAWDTKNNVV